MAKVKKNKEDNLFSKEHSSGANNVEDKNLTEDAVQENDPSGEDIAINRKDEGSSELKEALKNLEGEKAELEDLLRRQKAEFDNFRRRVNEERESFKLKANEDLLLGLLSILDNFNSALRVETDDQKLKNFLEGFRFIEKQFAELLEANNVSPSAEVGDVFNHNFHRALDFEQGEGEEDTICEIYKQGYVFADKVLRLADVRVKKKKLETEKNDGDANAKQ